MVVRRLAVLAPGPFWPQAYFAVVVDLPNPLTAVPDRGAGRERSGWAPFEASRGVVHRGKAAPRKHGRGTAVLPGVFPGAKAAANHHVGRRRNVHAREVDVAHGIAESVWDGSGLALCWWHVWGATVSGHVAHKADSPAIPRGFHRDKTVTVIELLPDVLLLGEVADCARVELGTPGISARVGPILHLENLDLVAGRHRGVPAARQSSDLGVLVGHLLRKKALAVRIRWRHIVLVGFVELSSVAVHHDARKDALLRGQCFRVVELRGDGAVVAGAGGTACQLEPVPRDNLDVAGLCLAGHGVLFQVLPGKSVVIRAKEPAAQGHIAVGIRAGDEVAGF